MSEVAIVGDGGKKSKRFDRRLITVAIAVVLIAGAAGAGARWLQSRNSAVKTQPEAPKLAKVVGELQDIRVRGDDTAYQHMLAKALNDKTLDASTRYMLYLEQGNGFVDKQQWQPAIDAYLKAQQIQKTFTVAELLAETYRQAGDKAKAAEYYRAAIARINSNSPTAAADKEAFELKLQDLEGQP